MEQSLFLFQHSLKKESDLLKFQAALHGCNLEGAEGKKSSSAPPPSKPEKFMFGDPSQYEGMPQEEKDKLTQEMMGHFKRFASDPVKYVSKRG